MNNKQGLTIAALIIAIIGLSIGFAAFSNTLTISQGATVDPSASNLKVVFANNYYTEQVTTLDTSAVVPTAVGTIGSNGTINNNAQNGPTLTGLKAAFTAPGQSVTYDLYVVNDGRLKAYLTDLVFGTTGSPAQAVSCTVATKDSNNQDIPLEQQATDSLVQAACAGISISVKIGNLSAMTSTSSLNNLELDVRDYKSVQIVITYAQGSAYVDGPMNVAFGDITLSASSVAAQSQQGGGEEPQQVTADDLIPTETEIGELSASDIDDDVDSGKFAYNFIGVGVLSYHDFSSYGMKLVSIEYNDQYYVWLCDSTTASVVSEMAETTILPYKWYNADSNFTPTSPYSEITSPINASDFNSGDIKSVSYVTRVINSFSNSNS